MPAVGVPLGQHNGRQPDRLHAMLCLAHIRKSVTDGRFTAGCAGGFGSASDVDDLMVQRHPDLPMAIRRRSKRPQTASVSDPLHKNSINCNRQTRPCCYMNLQLRRRSNAIVSAAHGDNSFRLSGVGGDADCD